MSSSQQPNQSASGSNAAAQSSNFISEQLGKKISYACGDCNALVQLTTKDHIRCLSCGYRVLYKLRTEQVVQFEAR